MLSFLLKQIFFGSIDFSTTLYGLLKKRKLPEIGLCPYPALKFSDMDLYHLNSMPIFQWLPSISSGIDYLLSAKHIWDPEIHSSGFLS